MPAADPLPRPLRLALTFGVATAAALLAQRLHVPLPWTIGPLLATALCSVAGAPVLASNSLRSAGLCTIGAALGLYFTPEVIALTLQLAPLLLLGVAWAFVLAYAFYRLLLRVNGGDRATAFFAAAIGGASEMALLAERHQGRVDYVAAAHSLRVLLVVVVVPLATQLAGIHGADAALPAVLDVRPEGLLLLVLAALVGVALLWRLGAPNPWVLGALLATLLLTGSGLQLSALPRWATNAAQLCIGVSLGSRFTADFASAAPRWMTAVALGTLAMITASAAVAWVVATLGALNPGTALLGLAPGGIAEMCITAKVLQLGVPAVTAFQVVRYLAVLTLTAPLYRWEAARSAA
jgi:uncharacterized protein